MHTPRPTMTTPAAWLAAGALLLTLIPCRTLSAAATPAEQEAKQIAVLTSDADVAAKATACRALVRIATPAAVPALARLLDDEKLSHMARYALEPIPDPAVDEALRAALARLSGQPLVGVIGSVSARRDAGAVEALAKRLPDADVQVRQAAARALGQIGTPAAAQVLTAALGAAAPDTQPAVIEGLLRNAEALAGTGRAEDRTQALALYEALRSLPQAPHQVRAAAFRGVVLLRGDEAVPLVLEALRGEDYALAAAATRTAIELPGAAVVTGLADALGRLPEERQILALSVLGKRGDPATLGAISDLARKGAVPSRVAAVRTLAEVGDASATVVLADLQRDPEVVVARAAKEALAALAGPQVDAILMAQLAQGDAAARSSAIELLGQRRVVAAIPALLKAAQDADEGVRISAIKVLGDLCGPDQFGALVGLLVQAPSAPTQQAAEAALVALCVREARPAPGRVTIRQAVYGKLPEGPTADITAKVAAMVAAGTFAIEASNGNFGDPAPNVVKSMRLEYAVDGTTESKTVRENETVTITAGAAPPALSQALCAALPQASPASRRALLRVLRAARGPAALTAVQDAIKDPEAETRDEAVSILCNWPTPAALDPVLGLAEQPPNPRARILALRGVFRLVPLLDAPVEARMAALGRALPLAERKEERLLALTALATVPSVQALQAALGFLGTADLKEEAAVAVLAVAEQIAPQHAAEAADAATKVTQAGVSPASAKRAEDLLAKTGAKPAK